MDYLLLKWVHIISSTILFGTGIGSAFFMLMVNLRKDTQAMYFVIRHVVIADWLFTTPAVITQLITGLLLVRTGGFEFTETWIQEALSLYVFAGICWLPVVWMQIKMRDMAKLASTSRQALPTKYWRLNRWWIALGSFAFPAVALIFYLMVAKP